MAFFQNSVDVWIMYSEEMGWDWYNVHSFREFTSHLLSRGVRMEKFPLCIKESGGMFERGRDKAKFLEELSKFSGPDASAYTIKLSPSNLAAIRSFNQSQKR